MPLRGIFDSSPDKGSQGRCRTKANTKQSDTLKFESGRFVNRPYKVANLAGPMVLVYRRSEGPKCQRRLAAEMSAATGRTEI